jgi:hypothetical protein
MVQLAWLWLRHQPTSALSRWYKGKRSVEAVLPRGARRLL